MNQTERLSDSDEFLNQRLEDMSSQIRVAMPGIVNSVDLQAQTVTVQLALQGKVSGQNTSNWQDMPLLLDVPIVWPRAGGFALTLPVKAGDECLVVFGDRCIDSWWQSGGVQKPMDERTHDLSDAFAVFGITSQPRKLANVQADAIELRDDGRANWLQIKNGSINAVTTGALTAKCATADIVASGSVRIKAPTTTVDGNLIVTGSITGQGGMTISGGHGATVKGSFNTQGGDIKADNISLKSHVHGNVQNGGGTTSTAQ